MSKIVIDPGHGGTTKIDGSSANNASGPKGTKEKDMTLKISVKVAELLNQAGYDVRLTRNSDVNIGLPARAKVAVDHKAIVFVSIHFNGNTDPKIQGTETWVHPAASSDSKLLGASLLQRQVQVTGYKNRGLRSAKWGVLNPAIHNPNTACCLAEISFISDPADEGRLLTSDYQNKLAAGIARAVTDFIDKSSSIKPIEPVPGVLPVVDGDG